MCEKTSTVRNRVTFSAEAELMILISLASSGLEKNDLIFCSQTKFVAIILVMWSLGDFSLDRFFV